MVTQPVELNLMQVKYTKKVKYVYYSKSGMWNDRQNLHENIIQKCNRNVF